MSENKLPQYVQEHFVAAFRAAQETRVEDPFCFAKIKDAWHPDIAEKMLELMPTKLFTPFKYPDESRLPDGTWTRRRIELNKKGVRNIYRKHSDEAGNLWSSIFNFLQSRMYQKCVYNLIGHRIESGATTSRSFDDFSPIIISQILEDSAGYQIKPHTDSESKRVTNQYYITDRTEETGSTLFYNSKGGEAWKKIDEAKFEPGGGYIFARSKKSFHGVAPYKGELPRYSLIVRCY